MSEDIIYREAAIEAIHSYWKGELNKMPTTDSEYGEVIDGDCDTLLKHNKELSTRIKDIPSADRPSGYIHIDDVYRLIAGHSDYHGDSILSAFTCLTEGKEVKPIKPLE